MAWLARCFTGSGADLREETDGGALGEPKTGLQTTPRQAPAPSAKNTSYIKSTAADKLVRGGAVRVQVVAAEGLEIHAGSGDTSSKAFTISLAIFLEAAAAKDGKSSYKSSYTDSFPSSSNSSSVSGDNSSSSSSSTSSSDMDALSSVLTGLKPVHTPNPRYWRPTKSHTTGCLDLGSPDSDLTTWGEPTVPAHKDRRTNYFRQASVPARLTMTSDLPTKAVTAAEMMSATERWQPGAAVLPEEGFDPRDLFTLPPSFPLSPEGEGVVGDTTMTWGSSTTGSSMRVAPK